MSVTGFLRGHPMYFADGEWRYVDTDELTAGNARDCHECGKPPTVEGHDPCLGTLPGVQNACCGHGDPTQAYIQYEDGRDLRGAAAFREFPPRV
jgi:hypothetical protein